MTPETFERPDELSLREWAVAEGEREPRHAQAALTVLLAGERERVAAAWREGEKRKRTKWLSWAKHLGVIAIHIIVITLI